MSILIPKSVNVNFLTNIYEPNVENSENIQHQLPPQAVAKIFEKLCKKEEPQLVLLGKQAIDDDSNATGQLLAETLGIPQVCDLNRKFIKFF